MMRPKCRIFHGGIMRCCQCNPQRTDMPCGRTDNNIIPRESVWYEDHAGKTMASARELADHAVNFTDKSNRHSSDLFI